MPHIRDSSYEKGEILSIIAIVFLTISLIGVTAATNAGPQLINSFAKFTEGTGEEKKSKEESNKDKEKKEEKSADKPAANNTTMGGFQEGTGSVPLDTNQPVTEVNQVKEKTDDGFITHTTTVTTDPATNTIIDSNTVSTTNDVFSTIEKTDDGFITHTTTIERDVDTNKIVNSQTTNTTNETATEYIETDGGTVKIDTTITTDLDTGQTSTYTSPGTLITQSANTDPLGNFLSSIGGDPNFMTNLAGDSGYTPGLFGTNSNSGNMPNWAFESEEGFQQWSNAWVSGGATGLVVGTAALGGAAVVSSAVIAAGTAGVPLSTYTYVQAQTYLQTNPVIPQTLNAINLASKTVSLTECAIQGHCDPSSVVPSSSLGSGLQSSGGVYGLNVVNSMNSLGINNPLTLYNTTKNVVNLPTTAEVAVQQTIDTDPVMIVAAMVPGMAAAQLVSVLQSSISQNVTAQQPPNNSSMMLQGMFPLNPVLQPINGLGF